LGFISYFLRANGESQNGKGLVEIDPCLKEQHDTFRLIHSSIPSDLHLGYFIPPFWVIFLF